MKLSYYIEHIGKCSPLFLVGGYVPEFRKIAKSFPEEFSFYYLREKSDMTEFVDSNSGRIFPNCLVIDIGVDVVPYIDGLLKFIEDYKGYLIVTSNKDINNLVFLSRFKLEFRKSMDEVNFLLPSHKNTLNEGISEETKLLDPIIWYKYIGSLEKFSKFYNYGKAEDIVTKCINIFYS